MMQRHLVSSGAVWEPVVGYSRAVRVGPWVSVAGMTAAAEGGVLLAAMTSAPKRAKRYDVSQLRWRRRAPGSSTSSAHACSSPTSVAGRKWGERTERCSATSGQRLPWSR
jgi:hypothetical protein